MRHIQKLCNSQGNGRCARSLLHPLGVYQKVAEERKGARWLICHVDPVNESLRQMENHSSDTH